MRRFFAPTGSVSRITVESHALENNMLGDPSVRAVDIYLPAGRDGLEKDRRSVVEPERQRRQHDGDADNGAARHNRLRDPARRLDRGRHVLRRRELRGHRRPSE